jgi:hypothetical protein
MGVPVLSRAIVWYLNALGACPNDITIDIRTNKIKGITLFMIVWIYSF